MPSNLYRRREAFLFLVLCQAGEWTASFDGPQSLLISIHQIFHETIDLEGESRAQPPSSSPRSSVRKCTTMTDQVTTRRQQWPQTASRLDIPSSVHKVKHSQPCSCPSHFSSKPILTIVGINMAMEPAKDL